MTKEIIESKLEATQRELQGRTTELQNITKRGEELGVMLHNLKVQIATYEDLLKEDTPSVEAEVRETMESLVGE